MRRFVNWFLFETALGDRLIGLAERRLGIGVLPVVLIDDSLDALATELLDNMQIVRA